MTTATSGAQDLAGRDDLITAEEAREILGINKNKMAEFLRYGQLKWTSDPRDLRVKLLSRRDVVTFARQYAHTRDPRRGIATGINRRAQAKKADAPHAAPNAAALRRRTGSSIAPAIG